LGGLTVYLANRKSNTVSRFLATEATPIRYLPEGDNILWALQSNGQLAVIRPEAFREFLASADSNTAQALVFEPVADRPRSKADLSRALLPR
jgi:DNA-binding beta-propeller fold protein YncE